MNNLRTWYVDIFDTLKNISICYFLAASDTKARYKRSVLGPLWITFGTAIGVVGLGFVWSNLLKIDFKIFVPSLTAGLVCWQLISGVVVESTGVFVRQASVIRNINRPLFLHPVTLVFRHVINFFHNIILFFVVAYLCDLKLTSSIFLFLPLFLVLIINLFFMSLLLGIIGARYRDLEPIVSALMPIFFFISPVIYRADKLQIDSHIVWLNPFTYYLAMLRDPLTGAVPSISMIIIFISLTLIIIFSASYFFKSKYGRIAFWV